MLAETKELTQGFAAQEQCVTETYDLNELLDWAYNAFNMDRTKVHVVSPIVENENRKCYIRNFFEMAKSINRSPDVIQAYLQKEIGFDTSITGNNHLKFDKYIKDKKLVSNHFKTYITDHVACKSCKSIRTEEIKEGRIRFLLCSNCKCKVAIKN